VRLVLFIGWGWNRNWRYHFVQDFGSTSSTTWPDLPQAKAFLKTMPCCRDENQLMALLVSRVTGREHEHRSVGTITIFGDLPAAF